MERYGCLALLRNRGSFMSQVSRSLGVKVSRQPGLLRMAYSYYQRGRGIADFMLICQIRLKPNLQLSTLLSGCRFYSPDSPPHTLLKSFIPEALPLPLMCLALSCSRSILELVGISSLGHGGRISSSSQKAAL